MASVKGGDRIKVVLNQMAKSLSSGRYVRAGFLENATYPNGTPVAMIAAIQDFGAPKVGIPPRPFFRNMIAAKSPQWPQGLARALKATDYDAEKSLALMGEQIKGELQKSIIDTNSPALSPVTVMLRGMKSHDQKLVVNRRVVAIARQRVAEGKTNYGASTKVLIESGHMSNSVDYEVKK